MRKEVYSRPNKSFKTKAAQKVARPVVGIQELKAPLVVDKFTECHVTPKEIASRMVEFLDADLSEDILEPSAGTGALALALINAGLKSENIHLIERHISLCGTLYDNIDLNGSHISNTCFLDYAQNYRGRKRFKYILMNPPFKMIHKHIAAAISLLDEGGRIVALVPSSYQHNLAVTLDVLGPETFLTAKVHTKIILIEMT